MAPAREAIRSPLEPTSSRRSRPWRLTPTTTMVALAPEAKSTTAAGTAGTMGEALAVAHLLLRNKTITDPAAGTITVYDTDGTTVLFVADLFEDAAGTTAYTGAGAERRERLA